MVRPFGQPERPWSVQLELVEGCTRQCPFCGINAIRSKPGDFKFMTKATALRCATGLASLCPTARYEFAMHGEPLAHPQRLDMIGLFRSALPDAQFQVTTNGAWLSGDIRGRAQELFDAGIDFIVLDTYEPEREKLRKSALMCRDVFDVLDFYANNVQVYANHRRKLNRTIVLMDDIGLRDGESSQRVVLNHAGSNPSKLPISVSLASTCTNVFRELSVCWNGDVCVCCMDWRHEQVMGNVNEQSPQEIWIGERFQAARAMLQSHDRRFRPCCRCDKKAGPRVGLLPKYPPPTDEQRALLVEHRQHR